MFPVKRAWVMRVAAGVALSCGVMIAARSAGIVPHIVVHCDHPNSALAPNAKATERIPALPIVVDRKLVIDWR